MVAKQTAQNHTEHTFNTNSCSLLMLMLTLAQRSEWISRFRLTFLDPRCLRLAFVLLPFFMYQWKRYESIESNLGSAAKPPGKVYFRQASGRTIKQICIPSICTSQTQINGGWEGGKIREGLIQRGRARRDTWPELKFLLPWETGGEYLHQRTSSFLS